MGTDSVSPSYTPGHYHHLHNPQLSHNDGISPLCDVLKRCSRLGILTSRRRQTVLSIPLHHGKTVPEPVCAQRTRLIPWPTALRFFRYGPHGCDQRRQHQVNVDSVSITPKTPTRANRADLHILSSGHPRPTDRCPRPSDPARDVHRISREDDRARARGQAVTAGPGSEQARGHAWGGDHRWKRQAKNGVIHLSVVVPFAVFSYPSAQPQGSVIQSIQSIFLFRSSTRARSPRPRMHAHRVCFMSFFCIDCVEDVLQFLNTLT